MEWDEYVNSDPRRLAQAAINKAAEERRRVAKDDNATDEEFEIACKNLRDAQMYLESLNKTAIKTLFD